MYFPITIVWLAWTPYGHISIVQRVSDSEDQNWRRLREPPFA